MGKHWKTLGHPNFIKNIGKNIGTPKLYQKHWQKHWDTQTLLIKPHLFTMVK
jgi:hypothetical protein